MKLSFTTAGCPGWSFSEILATAKDIGMAGVEIRGIGSTVYAPDLDIFSDENIDGTIAKMRSLSMEFPVLDSDAALALPDCAEAALHEAKAYIDLAERLGTKYIRVLGTRKAHPEKADLSLFERLYAEVCEYGAEKGVTPLVETNGVLADSAMLAQILSRIPVKNFGVLWDIHHPYRFFGETPEETIGNIGQHIRHTHIKDSVMNDGILEYRMFGYGDVPIDEAVRLLKQNGYDGYISLEWLKRWNPALQEPGVVFAHFASYMDYLFGSL